MIDYAYENLFADNQTIDIIICQHDATLTWDSTNHVFTVTDSDFVITTEDIIEDEFELDEVLCSEHNLKWGLCESAHIEFSFFNRSDLPTDLSDELIDVFIYFDEDPNTLFQVGVYLIDEDIRSDDRAEREISAFDLLYYLRDFDISEWYYGTDEIEGFFPDATTTHTIEDCIDDLFEYLQVEADFPIELLGDQDLINGDFTIGRTIESDTITFEFFMQRLLEINGVFGHINRQGKFEYIAIEWYDKDPKRIVVDEERYPPTVYEDKATWGIGQIKVYDRNNTRIFKQRNTNKKYPSTYSIVDSFVFANRKKGDAEAKEALRKLQEEKLWHINYRPCEINCIGDLCLEVGDRFDVVYYTEDEDTEEEVEHKFRSIIMSRHVSGLVGMEDVYVATGDKKQPKYKITNDKWHNGDSEDGLGREGFSAVVNNYDNFVEIIRNIGFRLLNEPSGVKAVYDDENFVVKLKWTDPDDISTNRPATATWRGTVVVRRDDRPPVHRWDGDLIVNSTTRNEYEDTWLEDNTIEENKTYYYGIFPYDTLGDYRFTKVITLNTSKDIVAPTILEILNGGAGTWDGSEVDILDVNDNNKLTVQISNSTILFKLYSGSTVIYSFTSPVGTQPSDAQKVHVAFLKDDTNQVAKPSFVYHTGTGTYSYNQESPTKAEMESIYEWLYPSST